MEESNRLYPRIDRAHFPIRENAHQQFLLSTALDRVPQNDPGNLFLHFSKTPPSGKNDPLVTWFFQPDLLHSTACLNATAEEAAVATARLFAFYGGNALCHLSNTRFLKLQQPDRPVPLRCIQLALFLDRQRPSAEHVWDLSE